MHCGPLAHARGYWQQHLTGGSMRSLAQTPASRFSLLVDAQFLELRRDVCTMTASTHPCIDKENVAILSDVKRPPLRHALLVLHQSILHRHLAIRITQNRIVEIQGLSELRIRFFVVAARGEVSDIELGNFFATLTE